MTITFYHAEFYILCLEHFQHTLSIINYSIMYMSVKYRIAYVIRIHWSRVPVTFEYASISTLFDRWKIFSCTSHFHLVWQIINMRNRKNFFFTICIKMYNASFAWGNVNRTKWKGILHWIYWVIFSSQWSVSCLWTFNEDCQNFMNFLSKKVEISFSSSIPL